ncbi:DNA translocase FtsK, partial [Methylobacterium sp. A54F]
MSLRLSLTRRLAGGAPRPSYAIAGTRPAPSWSASPQALLGREPGEPQAPYPSAAFAPEDPGPDQGWSDQAWSDQAWQDQAWQDQARQDQTWRDAARPRQAWPDQVFDDRADPAQLRTVRESRIDLDASSPGLLVRQPRRPAAITPEGASAPRAAEAVPTPSAVRFTRTPDTVLQERRQRALDAERAALEQAQAEAQAAALAVLAERAAAEAAARQAAEQAAETASAAERAAAEAALAPQPVPLWRQPFVPPPGVRFFRTPDRRPARPATDAAPEPLPAPAAAPIPAAPDWSELASLSDLQPWFDEGDWCSVEAWSAVAADAPAAPPEPPRAEPFTVTASGQPAERYVSVPVDITHLRSLPAAPVYVLDRLVRFDHPPRPADSQDNGAAIAAAAAAAPVPAARPTLSLVFGPGLAPPAAQQAPAARPAPLSAMAARAAIRAAMPPAPSMPVQALPVQPLPVQPLPVPTLPVPSLPARPAAVGLPTLPVPTRPVLLRGRAAPQPVAEVPEAPEAALPEPMAEAEPAVEPALLPATLPVASQTPLPSPAGPAPLMPRAILPEPRAHLIPAGRHLAVSVVENADYEHPSLELLAMPEVSESEEVDADVLEQNALNLQQTVQDFGVRGDILAVRPGPVVTLYELEPAPGTKSSRVIGLSDDIARSMSAVSARVAVVPGRNVIGIELPNDTRETVYLRELLSAPDFAETKQKLALCLGKNIGGEPIIADLARMPHLLVAGTTGSGKSVAINTMILSLLYRLKPEECRLIMVDPKMLELSVYDGIPHLLSPVVIDPKKAVIALKWAVREMEERYKKMSKIAVRNIDGYNARMKEARERGEVITRTVQTGFDRHTGEAVYEQEEMDLSALPYIVIVVDEMADLMMVAGKEIE